MSKNEIILGYINKIKLFQNNVMCEDEGTLFISLTFWRFQKHLIFINFADKKIQLSVTFIFVIAIGSRRFDASGC